MHSPLHTVARSTFALALLAGVPAVSAQEGTAVAAEEGFGVEAENGDFSFRIRGGIHADQRFFISDDDESHLDQFQMRRARLDLQATAYRHFDVRLHTDFANSRVELLDVYGNLEFSPAVQLRVGKMKAPLGMERLQSSWALLFAERAFPSSLLPNRDIGAQILGVVGGGVAEYAVGVFNGSPDGANADGDGSDSKDLNARLILSPFRDGDLGPLDGLNFGGAVSVGEQLGTTGAPVVTSYRTGGRELFFRYRADGSGTAVAAGRRVRLVPQASLYWDRFSAMAEYVREDQEIAIGGAMEELRNTAWQVSGSVVLTGETPSFRGLTPDDRFDRGEGDWGALELAARVNGIDFDADSFPTFVDPTTSVSGALAWAVGVNWYLNRFVRLLVNFEKTDFDAAPGGFERDSENVLISRLQFVL